MQTFKKTLRTILGFLLCFILISTLLLEALFHSERHPYQDYRERAELAGTLDTLIAGASYAKRALIPEIIDAQTGSSTYNLSGSDMTMQGRYELLSLEIRRNPVKTVYLELSMHSMNLKPDEDTLEGDLYVIPRLTNPLDRIRYTIQAFSPRLYGWVYRQLLYRARSDVEAFFLGEYQTRNQWQMRGYNPFDEGEEYREITATPESRFGTREIDETKYEKHIRYLEKIVQLCQENGIHLVFIMVPMSDYSVAQFSTNMQNMHDYFQEFADAHGLEYYDFNLWKEKSSYIPDTMYQNPTHMGNDAAPIFSEQFGIIMNALQKGADPADYFYPDYETLYRDHGYIS